MPAYRDAMCGRFVLPEEAAVLACWPQIAPIQDGGWKACFNVAPARTVPVLVRNPAAAWRCGPRDGD
jgi:putative SOS response-associated peptidase YedK